MLGTLDDWLMSHLSQRPSDPAYHIEDWRISSKSWKIKVTKYSFFFIRMERLSHIIWNNDFSTWQNYVSFDYDLPWKYEYR